MTHLVIQKRIYNHKGVILDTHRKRVNFTMFYEGEYVAQINIKKNTRDHIKGDYVSILMFHDYIKCKISDDVLIAIMELYIKFAKEYELTVVGVCCCRGANVPWHGDFINSFYSQNHVAPQPLIGKFVLVQTSLDSAPVLMSTIQRDQLYEMGMEIYGLSYNFLPYSTHKDIKDTIIIRTDIVNEASEIFNESYTSSIYIKHEDDLKNSTLINDKGLLDPPTYHQYYINLNFITERHKVKLYDFDDMNASHIYLASRKYTEYASLTYNNEVLLDFSEAKNTYGHIIFFDNFRKSYNISSTHRSLQLADRFNGDKSRAVLKDALEVAHYAYVVAKTIPEHAQKTLYFKLFRHRDAIHYIKDKLPDYFNLFRFQTFSQFKKHYESIILKKE